MKYLVLLLAAAAFASATYIAEKSVNVLEDGTMIIRCENGKKMIISKSMGPYGQELLEIELTGPNVIGKKIQIDDHNLVRVSPDMEQNLMKENYRLSPRWEINDDMERSKRSKMTEKSQSGILGEIMTEFQGVVDEASYEKLLAKVQKAVQKGKVSAEVLEHLQELAQGAPWNTPVGYGVNSLDATMSMKGMGKWGQLAGISGKQGMWMGAQWPMSKWSQEGKWWQPNIMSQPLVCSQAVCEQMPSWCYMNCQGMQNMNMIYQGLPMTNEEQMMRMKGLYPMGMSPMSWNPRSMGSWYMPSMGMTPSGISSGQSLPWVQNSMKISPMSQRVPISEDLMDNQMLYGNNMMGAGIWYLPRNTYPLEERMVL